MAKLQQRYDGNIGKVSTFNFPCDGEKTRYEFSTEENYNAYLRGLQDEKKEVKVKTRENYAKKQSKRKMRVARVKRVNGKRVMQII